MTQPPVTLSSLYSLPLQYTLHRLGAKGDGKQCDENFVFPFIHLFPFMSLTVATKRDVREQVRIALQPLLDDASIETEDLQDVTKTTTAAMSVPTTVSAVHRHALTDLVALLQEHQANSALITTVQGMMAVDAAAEEAPQQETPPATSHTEKQPALSFDAFKARMARRREEMQASSKPSVIPTAVMEGGVPLESATAGAPSAALTETSAHDSLGASPALGPSTAPDLQEETLNTAQPAEGTSIHEEGSVTERKKARTEAEVVVLTATPLDDDLYADLIFRPERRGRGRGGRGYGGRGRGGPPQYTPPYYGSVHHYGAAPQYRGGYYPPYQ